MSVSSGIELLSCNVLDLFCRTSSLGSSHWPLTCSLFLNETYNHEAPGSRQISQAFCRNRSMTQRRYISVWLVLLSLALLQAQNASAQSRMHLGKAKLVSPGVGWATVQQYPNEAPEGSSLYSTCLYWTQDNGKKWRDITPPHTSLQTLSEVFFLDSSFGWVILTETGLEDNNMGFHLLSTRDAGKTWVSLPVLQGTTYKLMDGMSPSEIFFSDSQHGWLVLYWHTMNSTATSLLATARSE